MKLFIFRLKLFYGQLGYRKEKYFRRINGITQNPLTATKVMLKGALSGLRQLGNWNPFISTSENIHCTKNEVFH